MGWTNGKHVAAAEQRGPNKWLIRVFIGYDPKGKRKYISEVVHGTKKKAQRALTKLQERVDDGAVVASSTETVAEDLARWLDFKQHNVRRRTAVNYKDMIDRYVCPEIGPARLDKLTTLDIQNFYSLLQRRRLSSRTVRLVHDVLSQALKQAVKWRLLAQNPASFVDLPRKQRPEVLVFSESELRRQFRAAAKGSKYERRAPSGVRSAPRCSTTRATCCGEPEIGSNARSWSPAIVPRPRVPQLKRLETNGAHAAPSEVGPDLHISHPMIGALMDERLVVVTFLLLVVLRQET